MSDAGPQALQVAGLVFDVLERLGVRYQLGGSLASTIHGVPRQTHDVDVVAELRSEHAAALAAALGDAFYLDPERIRHAVATGTSCNLIHLASGVKIDLFPLGETPFDQEELARSQRVELGDPPRAVPVKSPEDTVLRKLLWFRAGGEVSDRQWSDVVGVLRTQGAQLDAGYLDRQAASLGVAGLLARARREAVP